MTQIYCELVDCENNEESLCHAGAIRLSENNCCLTYQALGNVKNGTDKGLGDKLLWDKEFLEDDLIDD